MRAPHRARAMGLSLGQMDPVRADPRRQVHISTNEKLQPAVLRDRRQAPRADLGVRGAEMAVDDRAARRQLQRNGLGIGRPRRVREEQQRGQGLPQASPRR